MLLGQSFGFSGICTLISENCHTEYEMETDKVTKIVLLGLLYTTASHTSCRVQPESALPLPLSHSVRRTQNKPNIGLEE